MRGEGISQGDSEQIGPTLVQGELPHAQKLAFFAAASEENGHSANA
jgi:hypothetical protein